MTKPRTIDEARSFVERAIEVAAEVEARNPALAAELLARALLWEQRAQRNDR